MHEGTGGGPRGIGPATPRGLELKSSAMRDAAGPMIGELSRKAQFPVDLTEAGQKLMKEGQALLATKDPRMITLGKAVIAHAEPMLGEWKTVPKLKTIEQPTGVLDASGKALTKPAVVQDGTERVWVANPYRSYEQAHKLRESLDKLIYKPAEGGAVTSLEAGKLRPGIAAIRKAMDVAAQKEAPEVGDAIRLANRQYSLGTQTYDYAVGAAERPKMSAGLLGKLDAILGHVIPSEQMRNAMIATPMRKLANNPPLELPAAFSTGMAIARPDLLQNDEGQ
jgi:hypothetical protein